MAMCCKVLTLFTVLSVILGGRHDVAGADQQRLIPAALAGEASSLRSFSITGFEDLVAYAKLKAARPYQPEQQVAESLQRLSYDDYLKIHFKHDHAIWAKSSPFWIEMFHPGFVQKNQILLNLVQNKREFQVPFNPANFEYNGDLTSSDVPETTRYAGIRLAGRFPGSDDPQEILTFLGSSYFRCRSAGGIYGSSNRGLAVNIGSNQPEEFPVFREFWVVKPDADSNRQIVYAYMDSPTLAGAYEFTLEPGRETTTIDVRSILYFRAQPERLGIAPITSMWMWGDGLIAPPVDLRPAVHDADGLLVESEEGWTWRPLCRQSYPSVSRISNKEVRGFGLLQRNTEFETYQDSFAQYHKRPSIWIEPKNKWPIGHLELFELTAAHEGIDNIGAYWVPDTAKPLPQGLPISYRISYFQGDLKSKCREYLGVADSFQVRRQSDSKVHLTINFSGPSLADLAQETPVEINLMTIRAEVMHRNLIRRPHGKWSLQLVLEPTADAPFEIQAGLSDASRKLTETWSYLCPITPPSYEFPQVYTRNE